MKDRIPRYAGRIRLIPVESQENIYDMERADDPLQVGTPLNKSTLLSDETVEELGLSEDATPNEAIKFLNSKRKEFEEEMQDQYNEFLESATKIMSGSYVGTGTYGVSNPNTLTFNRPVKMLVILPDSGEYLPSSRGDRTDAANSMQISYYGTSSPLFLFGTNYKPRVAASDDGNKFTVSQFDTVVSWYVKNNESSDSLTASQQRNTSGKTYEYIAFM
jgi:hypothetical protein